MSRIREKIWIEICGQAMEEGKKFEEEKEISRHLKDDISLETKYDTSRRASYIARISYGDNPTSFVKYKLDVGEYYRIKKLLEQIEITYKEPKTLGVSKETLKEQITRLNLSTIVDAPKPPKPSHEVPHYNW